MKRWSLSLGLLCWLSAAPLYGETITAGQLCLDWQGAGTFTMHGDQGFQFDGHVSPYDGIFPAFRLTPVTGAVGSTIDLDGYWIGSAVQGVANGIAVGSARTDDYGEVRFSAGVDTPLTGTDVTLSVPFGFRGYFFLHDQRLDLDGFGLATVLLSRFPGDASTPPYWDFKSVAYLFQGATPELIENPEPMTCLLALTGLVAVWYMRRRPLGVSP